MLTLGSLLPKMTIEFSAPMGEKSRPIKKPIHAVDSLIQKLTILVLNAAVNFVILAFANWSMSQYRKFWGSVPSGLNTSPYDFHVGLCL